MISLLGAGLGALLAAAPPGDVVIVDRDNVEITHSCTVRVDAAFVVDRDGNGVVHVTADDIHVRFHEDFPLIGAPPEREPDGFEGVGIRVTGRNVTIEGARIAGFRAGLYATGAHALLVRDCDVSGNFRQRLESTRSAEARADWLWPHENDGNEWLTQYGAGVYIEDANDVTVHEVICRRGQNGIVLDRVNGSRIYDNDCSFLSGWGLALWRSSGNVICRNAFDFCVRGYSHGVYNRGQDSAGILLFEQCSDNVIVHNSATHGGDGLFAFAGREALGETNPREDLDWYHRRGNNDNLILANDFSDCAAHGLELTFSFDNRILDNRLQGNAICGIWGGYSQDTLIAGNDIAYNGDAGSGIERGGINIEHGAGNRIQQNVFRRNACAIHLWWDEDEKLLATPWARVNERGCADNLVADNRSNHDDLFLHLRRTGGVTRLAGNVLVDTGTMLDRDEGSPLEDVEFTSSYAAPQVQVYGAQQPVGARRALDGRANIILTAWGPYDWQEPMFVFDGYGTDAAGRPTMSWRMLGDESFRETIAPGPDRGWRAMHTRNVDAKMTLDRVAPGVLGTFEVTARAPGIEPVMLEYRRPGARTQTESRLLVWAHWAVRHFASPVDPRLDAETWRRGADAAPVRHVPRLIARFGSGGPEPDSSAPGAELPANHFGTIATTTLRFPPGRWRLRTTSDDGIRVWLDDELAIDDWTWHAPRTHSYEWTVTEERDHTLRVEHFELDGHAVLTVEIEGGAF